MEILLNAAIFTGLLPLAHLPATQLLNTRHIFLVSSGQAVSTFFSLILRVRRHGQQRSCFQAYTLALLLLIVKTSWYAGTRRGEEALPLSARE